MFLVKHGAVIIIVILSANDVHHNTFSALLCVTPHRHAWY